MSRFAMSRLTGDRRPDAFLALASLCLALPGLVATMGSAAAQSPPAVNLGPAGNLGSCSVFLRPNTTTIVYDTYAAASKANIGCSTSPTHTWGGRK